MEPQKAPHSNYEPQKEEQSWRNHTPNTKIYYKDILIKTTCYLNKNRHIDKWNGIKNP